jgi:hypothetical protein
MQGYRIPGGQQPSTGRVGGPVGDVYCMQGPPSRVRSKVEPSHLGGVFVVADQVTGSWQVCRSVGGTGGVEETGAPTGPTRENARPTRSTCPLLHGALSTVKLELQRQTGHFVGGRMHAIEKPCRPWPLDDSSVMPLSGVSETWASIFGSLVSMYHACYFLL